MVRKGRSCFYMGKDGWTSGKNVASRLLKHHHYKRLVEKWLMVNNALLENSKWKPPSNPSNHQARVVNTSTRGTIVDSHCCNYNGQGQPVHNKKLGRPKTCPAGLEDLDRTAPNSGGFVTKQRTRPYSLPCKDITIVQRWDSHWKRGRSTPIRL